ncbi:hypothetical protein AB0M43_36685 [Longispora sp. NPDC051575]|uniref:hypothetical protein n=1 Tax=Longispora sp. NPDC051575 TaxID=3154943 RepID=UPI00343AC74C
MTISTSDTPLAVDVAGPTAIVASLRRTMGEVPSPVTRTTVIATQPLTADPE